MNNNGIIYNPAGYIKNFNSLRIVCLWAGGLGLIQSLIFIALTITGILSYSCIINVKGTFNYGSLFPTVFLQLYFMGKCGDTIPAYDDSFLRQVDTVLNPQDILIWESVYLAVAFCWFLTSILLMACLKKDQPRLVSGLLWTWIFITSGICGMDLILGIIFGIDYSRFNRKAYMYNLTNMEAGEIKADAAQLLAGMVVSMTMLIVSLKGFVLWLTNVGFIIYLAKRTLFIGQDKNDKGNLYMRRREFDDIIATRPPINAYQGEAQKSSALSTVFANEGFEPDNQAQENAAIINREIIARAARLATDVSQHRIHFRNLDSFQQYPPRSRPESAIPEHAEQHQQATSPAVMTAFPAPDYTPPMQRASQNPNRNHRYP